MSEPLLVPGSSRLLTIEELRSVNLVIPPFQRPYDWNAEPQVREFCADLAEAEGRGRPLFLGLIVLVPLPDGAFAIVDGQQRLTSAMLALAGKLGTDYAIRAQRGIPSLWVRPREGDVAFTHSLLLGRHEPPKTLSQHLLRNAYSALSESSTFSGQTVLSCQVIAYVAPSLSGATGLFERINLRGKRVAQFDLVKNKLIEWIAALDSAADRSQLENFVSTRYDQLYKILDPGANVRPLDGDRLLKVHWILFDTGAFQSTDRVVDKVNTRLQEKHRDSSLAAWLTEYVNTLVEVATVWVNCERPYETCNGQYSKGVTKALHDFAKLGREAELQPLIVAALLRLGSDAEGVIRFCEVSSFRGALAKLRSNNHRSVKWRVAKELYHEKLKDATGNLIRNSRDLAHHLFWEETPYWSRRESATLDEELTDEDVNTQILPSQALSNPKFYVQYHHLIHYFFWKYGEYLPKSELWGRHVREDLNPFQESAWFLEDGFRSWDIEHLYPQNPDDRRTPKGREFQKTMSGFVHHLGNLTVLPKSHNRAIGNAVFAEKLQEIRNIRKVSFNELLDRPDYRGYFMNAPWWGPNNCRRRLARIEEFAEEMWGTHAIESLGVGKWDARVDFPDARIEDEEPEGEEQA